MPIHVRSFRHAIWLLAAALASFVGSGALLTFGSATQSVSGGGGIPGLGLYALVILLGLAGLVLLALAAKEYLDERRLEHLG